ncbi:MAG: hypothetical protein FWE67_15415 [Planctomycetaceae bacterium]|nr:hypothetical protein [Planctomycetaceae bacterium]
MLKYRPQINLTLLSGNTAKEELEAIVNELQKKGNVKMVSKGTNVKKTKKELEAKVAELQAQLDASIISGLAEMVERYRLFLIGMLFGLVLGFSFYPFVSGSGSWKFPLPKPPIVSKDSPQQIYQTAKSLPTAENKISLVRQAAEETIKTPKESRAVEWKTWTASIRSHNAWKEVVSRLDKLIAASGYSDDVLLDVKDTFR